MPGSRLSFEEREEIAVLSAAGWSTREIGREIGRDHTTVSRELKRVDSRGRYRAHIAQRQADRLSRRPKPRRVETDPELCRTVEAGPARKLSPMTISHQLRAEGRSLSHEAIYRAIYAGSFGDPRKLLCRPRRFRTARTRTGHDNQPLGPIKLIDQRPDSFGKEPGHWEGDLLVGKQNRSVAVVLTERVSRIVELIALPHGRRADHVADQIISALSTFPAHLVKTLTWDQGRELTRWQRIEKELGIDVYFCHPGSPWEKGLVENVCGLTRRWLPRNQPIPTRQASLNIYSQLLNTMPRRSLDWNTAQHTLDILTGATTS